MIYVSSSCVKFQKIIDSVNLLFQKGIHNIELSAGTDPYPDLESDLIQFKKQNEVNLLLHNYFPPPPKPFVLNLASLNDEVRKMSVEHIKRSLDLSDKLSCEKFAFHAGFFIDIKLNEIGKKLSREDMFDKDKAIDRFCESYEQIKEFSGNIKLYIENNVFSDANYQSFEGKNPFMLTSKEDYLELSERIDFKMLLDTAHLKVSSRTLNLDFESELSFLSKNTDYLHLSDNNSLADQNKCIFDDKVLNEVISSSKTFTLETYEEIDEVLENYEYVNRKFNER